AAYLASDRSSSDVPGECDAVSPTIGAIQASATPAGTTSDAYASAPEHASRRASSQRATRNPASTSARNTALLAWTRQTSPPSTASGSSSAQTGSRTGRKHTVRP